MAKDRLTDRIKKEHHKVNGYEDKLSKTVVIKLSQREKEKLDTFCNTYGITKQYIIHKALTEAGLFDDINEE